MNLEDLKSFLSFVAEHGYAGDAPKRREPDGSDTIELARGDWRFHDNYFTSTDGRRFHGREAIFFEGWPYWFIAYSGFVEGAADLGEVYAFLKEAMRRPEPELPIRGPKKLSHSEWRYTFAVEEGDLEGFRAVERIHLSGEEAYQAFFIGGLIS